jgi:hypothetical protein
VKHRDVALWAEWKKVDPKSNMSIFNQEPDLLNEPMGLDAVEVTEPLEVPGVDLHLIPDDDAAVIPDSEAGRIATAEENAARGASENAVISDETAREAASCKAKKLEREMKKLSWDSVKEKPAMNKATVIEFDKDGNETGEKDIHFAFNSELMKGEQDGSVRCKGRIVSLGHMQIPGVDHAESFLPVDDTSVRIVIGLSLFNDDWVLKIIDVEAAFLEGDMEKTMHIKWPAGMVHLGFITEEEENCCIEQLKSVCGNSDAALI